ncbi:MAG: permease [Candidatus Peribacteraceae bacterium]
MRFAFPSAVHKSLSALWRSVPFLLGIIFLVGFVQVFFPVRFVSMIFHHNVFLDSFMGSVIGSVMVGSPITSYVIGGEFLNQGVSLTAVTAFVVAWVSVGVVQFPAESTMLGRNFSLLRNSLSFLFSILVAMLTTVFLRFL